MILYQALYNSMIHESSAYTLSIHKTRKGAEMAIEFHKKEIKDKWEDDFRENEERREYPWDFCQWWGVEEIELKD